MSRFVRRPPLGANSLGILLGLSAALCYTGTNVALRGVTRDGDFEWALWVTCIKALPGALMAWGLVTLAICRNQPNLPDGKTIRVFLATGVLTQCGGNLFFQLSLAMCGLALAVPTVFATLILAGAYLGRRILGEPITRRAVAAMGLLFVAIGLLAAGATVAGPGLPPPPAWIHPTVWVFGGLLLSAIAGTFYGVLGVVIRRETRNAVPLSAALALVGTTGVVGLGVPALIALGPDAFSFSLREGALMFSAGTLNGIAFFAMAGALRLIPVIQVNLLNASQATLCALGGVLVYDETLSWGLVMGLILTTLGLLLLDRPKSAAIAVPPDVEPQPVFAACPIEDV